jgi:DNA-binding transcriptional LysR family regulator
MGWEAMTQRACREHGGFDPDIRHRTDDATVALALVAGGLAVTLLPALVLPERDPALAVRAIAGAGIERTIHAVTRAADAARPSTRALVAAVGAAAAGVRPRRSPAPAPASAPHGGAGGAP